MNSTTLPRKQICIFSRNFCGMLGKIYTRARTKKGNKRKGKEKSDHFLYGK
jgi:hypothetical protein